MTGDEPEKRATDRQAADAKPALGSEIPVPYDPVFVAAARDRNDAEAAQATSALSVFGPEFLEHWAARIEAARMENHGPPVCVDRLAKALDVTAFFAGGLSSMALKTADGVTQIDAAQKREALRLAAAIKDSVDAYQAFREGFAFDGEDPLLPDCGEMRAALRRLVRDIEHVEPRPRARGHADIFAFAARDVLRELTGHGGRSTDRVTHVETGLLFEFAIAILDVIDGHTPPAERASRVRTALRKLHWEGVRK